MFTTTASEARQLILKQGDVPELEVKGHLNLKNSTQITFLPDSLKVDSLDLSGCTNITHLPSNLKVKRLDISDCTNLKELPTNFSCYELTMHRTHITKLPNDLQVEYKLDLQGNIALTELPRGLKVGSLILRNCTGLQALPENLQVYFLDISGCTELTEWPENGELQVGRLVARNCLSLSSLPSWLNRITQLDLRDCVNIRELPADLQVTSWIDLAGTGVQQLPATFKPNSPELQWRGIPISKRVFCEPETITSEEVLTEVNAEVRRVLLERMGYEKFMRETQAQVLDRDIDAGGLRELLRVPIPNDEDLVCLAVRCPSTGQQYMLRVPPNMSGCHQAAAWLAGFDNPDDYHPVKET